MNEKNYVVFSQKLAGYLMMNNCRLLKIKPDVNEPTKFVYFFPNKDYVHKHVNDYKSKFIKK